MQKKRKKVAIYINSTDNNEIKLILAKLHDFINKSDDLTLYREYIEEYGEALDLINLKKLYKDAEKKKFEIVLVYELGHLGSSIRQLNIVLEKFNKNEIEFISLKNQLNTLTQGKLVFSLINELIKFESRGRRKKIKDGIEKARSRGKKLGRPRLPDSIYQKAKELRAKGLVYGQIGKLLDINEGTVRKRMKREEGVQH